MRIRRKGGSTRLPGIIGGPIAIVIGLGIGYFGWTMRIDTLEFVDSAQSASGSVVEVEARTDSDGDTLFYPVFEFTTAEGEEIQFRSNSGSNPPSRDKGEKVEILYDPNQPQNARENSFSGLWMFSTILLVFGGIFALAGVLGFFSSVLTLLGIGGLLGIGAWLLLRKKKDEDQEETSG
jgi:LPXTG-motif cell wall-anchored protein